MPLRFRVAKSVDSLARETAGASARTPFGTIEGESVNLSERGIYFRSRQRVNVGEPLEMYFTIPRELTGRSAEQVRCSARVVHVEPVSYTHLDVYKRQQQQAASLAYKDAVSAMAVLIACLIPLTFLMKRPPAHSAAPPMH